MLQSERTACADIDQFTYIPTEEKDEARRIFSHGKSSFVFS